MQVALTADGTEVFYVREGLWRVELSGTIDTNTTITLQSGPSEDGSDHVTVTDDDGSDMVWSATAAPKPQYSKGSGYFSAVVENYDSSADLVLIFRKAAPSSME